MTQRASATVPPVNSFLDELILEIHRTWSEGNLSLEVGRSYTFLASIEADLFQSVYGCRRGRVGTSDEEEDGEEEWEEAGEIRGRGSLDSARI